MSSLYRWLVLRALVMWSLLPYAAQSSECHSTAQNPSGQVAKSAQLSANGRGLLAPAANAHDAWAALVGTPAPTWGSVQKAGELPTKRYHARNFSDEPFQTWLLMHGWPWFVRGTKSPLMGTSSIRQLRTPTAMGIERPDALRSASRPRQLSGLPSALMADMPPNSRECAVYYNPAYRFIFIRNRKTASTTVLDVLRSIIPPATGRPAVPMSPERLIQKGCNLTAIWHDFTVFTTMRNPWARAASGYEFTHSKFKVHKEGKCAKPPFLQYCRNPFLMGTIDNMHGCSGQAPARLGTERLQEQQAQQARHIRLAARPEGSTRSGAAQLHGQRTRQNRSSLKHTRAEKHSVRRSTLQGQAASATAGSPCWAGPSCQAVVGGAGGHQSGLLTVEEGGGRGRRLEAVSNDDDGADDEYDAERNGPSGWRNHAFCHVEPVAPCLVDEQGRLAVDYVIRYEMLEDDLRALITLINDRRPAGLPPLLLNDSSPLPWKKMGNTASAVLQRAPSNPRTATSRNAAEHGAGTRTARTTTADGSVRGKSTHSGSSSAFVYADKYRKCGKTCVQGIAKFYSADIALFGWAVPASLTSRKLQQSHEGDG